MRLFYRNLGDLGFPQRDPAIFCNIESPGPNTVGPRAYGTFRRQLARQQSHGSKAGRLHDQLQQGPRVRRPHSAANTQHVV